MSDVKLAKTVVRGDRVNVSAALDAALGETDERFFFDHLTEDGPILLDATVEGLETHNTSSTVYTNCGAFSVPEDFPLRIVGYADDY